MGIHSSAILDFIEDIEKKNIEAHSFMLLKKGNVVSEGWWKPYSKDIPHMMFSLSKSFTSTAIGFLVDDGVLTVEDYLISYFPDDLPSILSDNLKKLKIKHLLSMNTGHTDDSFYDLQSSNSSWVKAFLAKPIIKEPGTHFLYNSGATYMLSALVKKVTLKTTNDFLNDRLYKPLGINYPKWDICPDGISCGGWGLNLTTEDIAKFGQFYLNKGRWNGKQLLSEKWINEASSKQS
jgi:CubicO group peptidase (beta-lactamase class C family)